MIEASVVEWPESYEVVDPDGIKIGADDEDQTPADRRLPDHERTMVGVIIGSSSDWEVMEHASTR